MSWNQTTFDFGTSGQNVKKQFTFKYEGDKEIENVSSSCGCTVSKYNSKTGEIFAEYSGTSIPNHLKDTGVKVSKKITVTFKDGTTQILNITGLVKH